MKMIKIFLCCGFIIAFLGGYHWGMGNQSLRYGKSGLPKNCRALITENIRGVASKKWSATDALDSIDRNCGANGLIWCER